MKFNTAFDRDPGEPAPLGSGIYPVYSYRIDKKTGKKQIVKTGETNMYERIQASLEGTKLENIIKRAIGDPSILNIREGNYIDVTELPTNMLELQNTILKAHDQFAELPAEIRKKFDNSVEMFVSEYGSESWSEKMGFSKPVPEPIKEETKEGVEENG